ncbi:MAG: inverse autotransporter beta domain-containing protein [Plesiomonas sp.]|uniref:inverse autotransporter beta domain-containing protein n=1 Tax=Plesiomonas sp. TaxID=2486279 RepID=UPI003F3A1620
MDGYHNLFFKNNMIMKSVAFLQLAVQVALLILSVTFPARTEEYQPLTNNSTSQDSFLSLSSYILKHGETIKSVAEKHALTIEQLWRFNRNLFSHNQKLFNSVTVGSEIMIPTSAVEPAMSDLNTKNTELASAVKNVAGVLSSEESKSNAVFGYLNSQVNSVLSDVLNKHFTAEVNFNYDLDSGLSDSSIDLLYPLFDGEDDTIFTQFGMRYYDDKTVANIGLGYRHIENESYLIGYNIFYDQQFTDNQHKRFGLGGEFNSSHTKLSVNLYKGISGWKSSSSLEDYDERVADGFDIMGEYRFKSLPQLSTTFSYEKYFGNEVVLFGINERQKDPYSVSAGLKYSPMSLLDFNIEHKIGKSGVNDTTFGLTFNYDFSKSLESQLSTNSSDFIIPFNQDRHALVKRNNNIVLEYKKQDVISIKTNGDVHGSEGDELPLSIQVNSRYEIKSINWSHPTLSSNGGSIAYGGDGIYTLKMPLYFSGDNKHKVTITATDIKGNISNQETFFAVVSGQNISIEKSTLDITPAELLADEKSTAKAIVTLLSDQGTPVSGAESRISMSLSSVDKTKSTMVKKKELIEPTLSAVKEMSPGQYESVITSGNIAGTASVVAMVDEKKLSSTVTFLADANSAFISDIKESKSQVIADSIDSVEYTVYVKDINNNPVRDVVINFSTDLNIFSANNSTNVNLTTDDKGKATVSLVGSRVGIAHVVASLPDGSSHNANPVTFISGSTSELKSTLLLIKSAILTDGKDTSLVIIQLNDSAGNPVDVDEGSIQLSDLNNNAQVFFTPVKKKQLGVYYSSVTATSVGNTRTANISATVNGVVLNPVVLTLLPAIGTETIASLVVDKNQLIADDNDQVEYHATVIDENGTPVPDIFVYWHDLSEHGQSTYSLSSKTDLNGIATTLLKTKKAGSVIIQATIAGNTQKNSDVIAIAGDIDVNKSIFSSNKTSIAVTSGNTSDSAMLNVHLVDKFDNLVTQQQVTIEDTAAVDGVVISGVVENTPGKYGSSILSTTMGEAKLQASVNGLILNDKINVTIGAIKPDLKFANATVTNAYTSNFSGSQAVQNAPANVTQRWSSNDDSVATVNNQGQVTLHKSGKAVITVLTDPTPVYAVATASYTLNVTLAEPQLRFAAPSNPSVWNIPYDGFDVITDNADVNLAELPMKWTSSNVSLATVNENSGNISLIKPGTTTITVNSEATDQFKAGTASYSLIIDKARLNIAFTNPLQEVLKTDQIILQQPTESVPTEVRKSWSSSNEDVLSIGSNDIVTVNAVGQAKITLTSQANDYYTESSGSYTVKVWGAPELKNIHYSYLDMGVQQSIDGTVWKPTYKNDSLTVKWEHSAVNEYDRPKEIEVTLIDTANNNELATSGPLSGSSTEHTFPAASNYVGLNIKVTINAVTLETADPFDWSSNNINVSSLKPNEIWRGVTLDGTIKLKRTDISGAGIISDAGSSCRNLWTDHETSLFMDWNVNVDLSGNTLLNPFITTMKTETTGSGGGSTFQGHTIINNQSIKSAYTEQWNVTNDDSVVGKSIHTLCWRNHNGRISSQLSVSYNGKNYNYVGDKVFNYTGENIKNRTFTMSFD